MAEKIRVNRCSLIQTKYWQIMELNHRKRVFTFIANHTSWPKEPT